jgi:hypothetical protein
MQGSYTEGDYASKGNDRRLPDALYLSRHTSWCEGAMSYLDYVVAKNTSRSINLAAATMGGLAILRAWVVIHPSEHSGFIDSTGLIAFELIKVAALLMVLCWVFVRNRSEDDRTVRSKREYAFSFVAAMSILIDIGIWLLRMQ